MIGISPTENPVAADRSGPRAAVACPCPTPSAHAAAWEARDHGLRIVSMSKINEGRARAQPRDSLATYLREIKSYPLLSRAEEAELGRRIRAGDREALERLVCSNLRFVVSIAKRYQHLGVPLADLIDEGNLGLIRAASRYDETKGAKFISYAVWWVRQSIVQAIADHGHAVRVPLGRAGTIYRIGRHARLLRQDLGREL